MTTLLTENGVVTVDARVNGDDLWLSSEETESATGWSLKEEGLCKGSVCVPIPVSGTPELVSGNEINLAGFWHHMNRPVLRDEAGEAWILGESADDRTVQLQSLDAPDFTLPDVNGNLHSLSDYRGKKVYLCSWASW